MTTNVIDIAFHGTSFPTSYIGPGDTIGNPIVATSVHNRVNGYFTSKNNATQINLGFRPRAIKVVNETDGIVWEWQYGMTATKAIKTTLGGSLASVIDTGTPFTITDGGAGVFSLTLSATLVGNAKLISFHVEG